VSYLGNDAINRVNLHTAIQALAQGAGGVFVFVYLLKAGVPVPWVLCTLAAMTAGRFVLRPIVLVFARRVGLRWTLVVGTILEAAIFPLLPGVHGPGPSLLLVIVVSAFGSVFYWTSLHAYTALLGDEAHRGRQVAVGAAVAAVMNIVAPWVGGWALGAFGAAPTFGLVAVVQVLAVAPLLGAPNPPVAEAAPPGGWRAARLAAAQQAADGWFGAGFYYVWQIALFVTLGEHFAAYGGAMALAGVVGAAATLVLGRLVDLGHGRTSVLLAYGVCAAVTVFKAVSLHSPVLAVLANALATIAAQLLVPTMMARIYNLAKASPCPLRFHMATEGGWDIGCCAGCLAAAGLSAAGVSLSAAILLALIGGALALWLLLHSYGALGSEPTPLPLSPPIGDGGGNA
jgi:MFS transporter, DHA1 family, inner membrane transport protein